MGKSTGTIEVRMDVSLSVLVWRVRETLQDIPAARALISPEGLSDLWDMHLTDFSPTGAFHYGDWETSEIVHRWKANFDDPLRMTELAVCIFSPWHVDCPRELYEAYSNSWMWALSRDALKVSVGNGGRIPVRLRNSDLRISEPPSSLVLERLLTLGALEPKVRRQRQTDIIMAYETGNGYAACREQSESIFEDICRFVFRMLYVTFPAEDSEESTYYKKLLGADIQ